MLRQKRQQMILDALREAGSVSASEMEQLTGSSKSTIRRDLDELAERGLIIKIRGGAMLPEEAGRKAPGRGGYLTGTTRQVLEEPSFRTRQVIHLDEKKRIAQAAHALVRPGETLILGSGTTIFEFSKTLGDISPLYCATNDLESAAVLSRFENVDLTVLGGQVRYSHYSIHGYFTEQMIGQMHADKVIFGADAIDLDRGYMNFASEDVSTNRCMIQAARKSILLADHSKFDSIAFLNLCGIGEIDVLITGNEADPGAVEIIRRSGVEVITV